MRITTVLFAAALSVPAALLPVHAEVDVESLKSLSVGEHRSADNRARNESRHPVGTLTWLGIEPDMTVVEIWPGGGWYAEILAPYLREKGRYNAAGFVTDAPGTPEYRKRITNNFVAKLAANPEKYGKVSLEPIGGPDSFSPYPAASADAVLTFRNVHNWVKGEFEQKMFDSFFAMLKPGGILGVIEHRAEVNTSLDVMKKSGYVTEAYVQQLALKAGFVLGGASAINANPADNHNHPAGVWTLPPSLRLKDENRAKYLAIGESDRMTLKFIKPDKQ